MHCMDSDYSVFSILPPYNTIEAQLIVNGGLVTNGAGYTVTYQAVADPDGSFNSTAMGKGNFYDVRRGCSMAPTLAPEHGSGRLGYARHRQHAAAHAVRANQPARRRGRHARQLVPRRRHPDLAL